MELLEVIDRAIEAGEDIYQIAVEMGRSSVEDMDEKRFMIGDLAVRLARKKYRTDMTARFAKDIGENVGRVRELKTVCAFWTDADRLEFKGLPLSYSHYRATARRGLAANRDVARALMQEAASNTWTAEKLGIKTLEAVRRIKYGDNAPPILIRQQIQRSHACIESIGVITGVGFRLALLIEDDVTAELLEAHKLNKSVEIVVTAEYQKEAIHEE